MSQHLKKIIGDKLHVNPPNMEDHYLPSPEKLKGKILIKGKSLPSDLQDFEGEVTDEEEGFEMSRRMMGGDNKDQLNGIGCKRLQLCKELSDLVTLCKSVQFRDFETSKREAEALGDLLL